MADVVEDLAVEVAAHHGGLHVGLEAVGVAQHGVRGLPVERIASVGLQKQE